ncbi:hypothetical protein D3C85_1439690 [compost metagenome]
MIQARVITQIGRSRRQTNARRAIARAGVAMAHRAMLGVERRASGRVRGDDRGLADFISHRQFCAQLPRLTGNLGPLLTRSNCAAQRADALLQRSLFRFRRHGRYQSLQGLGEFQLLAVLGLVDDLACLYRCRVVRADVVE